MSSFLNLPMLFAEGSIIYSANIVPVTIFLVLGASWIVSAVATACVKARETSEHNELKRMMIERGMNANEIERILAAGTDKQTKAALPAETSPPLKPQAGPMNWPVHSHS